MTMKNPLLEISRSKSTASRLVKLVSEHDLERAIENLKSAGAALRERNAAKAAKSRAKNLMRLEAVVDQLGLSTEDLLLLAEAKERSNRGTPKKIERKKIGAKRSRKVAPKYKLKVGQQTHKWTGRGRMPLVFKEFVEKGGTLEQCLIK